MPCSPKGYSYFVFWMGLCYTAIHVTLTCNFLRAGWCGRRFCQLKFQPCPTSSGMWKTSSGNALFPGHPMHSVFFLSHCTAEWFNCCYSLKLWLNSLLVSSGSSDLCRQNVANERRRSKEGREFPARQATQVQELNFSTYTFNDNSVIDTDWSASRLFFIFYLF